jgi:hypothetical protein
MHDLVTQDGIIIEKHPSRFFIRYLLSLGEGEGYGVALVERYLNSFSLMPVDTASLGREQELVRSARNRPKIYLPSNTQSSKNRLYWKGLQIESMHLGAEDATRATGWLSAPRIRHDVEVGLLGFVTTDRLSQVMEQRHGEGVIDPATILAFRHYFFNPDHMPVQEWVEWLGPRDQRALVVQGGTNLALHRLGLRTSISTARMLQHIQQALFFRFIEAETQATDGTSVRMLSELSREIRGVSDSLKDHGAVTAGAAEQFERFVMEVEEEEAMPELRSLAPDGNHSGSGKEDVG